MNKMVLIRDDKLNIALVFKVAVKRNIINNNGNEFEIDVYNNPKEGSSKSAVTAIH